jgi:hypothetical protein
MEPHRHDEISRPVAGDLHSRQTRAATFLLNEARCHTLDEYVAATPLSRVILPLMRACFFQRRDLRCCRRVMAIKSLPISPASSPKSRGRDPNTSHGISVVTPTEDDPAGPRQGIGLHRIQRASVGTVP